MVSSGRKMSLVWRFSITIGTLSLTPCCTIPSLASTYPLRSPRALSPWRLTLKEICFLQWCLESCTSSLYILYETATKKSCFHTDLPACLAFCQGLENAHMVSLTGQQLRKTPPIHRLLGSRSQRRLHCRKCTVVTDTNTCCPQPKLRDSESSYFLCPSKENEEVDSNLRKANNYWRRRGLLRGTILQAFLTSKNCLETSRSTGTILKRHDRRLCKYSPPN